METIARKLICVIVFSVLLEGADGAVASEEVLVQNCGTPGANTRESLARLPGVLAGKPDHLVILLGMNDAMNSAKLVGVKEYKRNVAAMTAGAEKGYRLLADEVAGALRERVLAGETVVCFGDSITFGSHMEGQGSATGKTYPAFLRATLSSEGAGGSVKSSDPQRQRLADIAPPGWAIRIEFPDGKQTRITSADEGLVPKVAVDETTGETRFVWSGLGSGPLGELTVHMTGKQRPLETEWRLEVENRGRASVLNVTFPDVAFPVGKEDMVVVPSVSGRLHRASQPLAYSGSYPSGSLTMQCCGLYGPAGGIYVAVHDPCASAKRLEMNSKSGRLTIRWQWPVPNMGVPGTGWKIPGEVVVRRFEGDWFDLAQIYRAWVEQEAAWWPRGEQAGRPGTPEWFKDIAVWVQIGGPWPRNRPPVDQDQIVPKVKRFAEYMDGIPCAVHWYNWHQIAFDDDCPHFFPAKDGFAEGVRQLQQAGVRVMPYINAHVWDKDLDDFKTMAYPAACKSRNGELPTKTYSGNKFGVMCPATPLWQKTVEDLVLRLAGPEFNADGVYLDQVSAQAPVPCFDKTHGHALGGGCWWTTKGYWPMLDRIRARLATEHLDTILTSESSAEPYANRLDGYLTWVGYRDGSNAIPLFHAVYGGQVQFFGRLYKWDSWKGLAMRMKTAQALVWGEQVGWIRTEVIDDPVAGPFLKRQARLRYVLRRYLSHGRMARPPAIKTDGTTVTANWVFTRDLMVTTPTILSGAWQRDDGNAVVLILVNVDDKPHSVDLPFDAAAYGLGTKLLARKWTGNEVGNAKPRARSVKATWNRHIDLAPLASLAIEIETAE